MKEYFKIAPDNIKGNQRAFFIMVFVIAIFLWVLLVKYILEIKEAKKELLNGVNYKTTVCEVIGYTLRFNSNIFDYVVDRKHYQHNYQNTKPLYIGERYMGRYRPSNPDIIVVYLTKPVIDTNEFKEAVCTLDKVDFTKGKNYVGFFYFVNNRRYKRIVYVKDASAFEIGKSYPILYNKNKPEVSYLYH